MTILMDQNTLKILEEIESGYDRVAEKFSATRNFFWKDLEFLSNLVKRGDKILDFGCGNGRLLEILQSQKIEYLGVDVSGELIKRAQKKYPQWRANFRKIEAHKSLPFLDDFFNVIFSVAVFHHFPFEYQKEKIRDLYRVLSPDGKLALTVWNLQEKYEGKETEISFQDNKGNVFNRYHYVFDKEELKNLVEEAGFRVKKCDIINKKNILIITEK